MNAVSEWVKANALNVAVLIVTGVYAYTSAMTNTAADLKRVADRLDVMIAQQVQQSHFNEAQRAFDNCAARHLDRLNAGVKGIATPCDLTTP